MGFFDLSEVIEAFKVGKVESVLADLDLNDLALIQHEVTGYAVKHNRKTDLAPLIATIENLIDERRAALE